MNTSAIAVLTLVGLFAFALVKGIITARRRRHDEVMSKQESINRAAGIIAGLSSVVEGAAAAMAAVQARYDAAIAALKDQLAGREDVDTSGLDAASAHADSARAAYAAAVAANTPASDEVHVDNGGTGTGDAGTGDGTVVDPATVDVTAVTEAATQPDTATGGEVDQG